jgi:hypothetical protein
MTHVVSGTLCFLEIVVRSLQEAFGRLCQLGIAVRLAAA